MLAELGFTIQPTMKVLVFGDSWGKLVALAVAQGFDAYGCYDIQYSYDHDRDPTTVALRDQGRLQPISTPYQLPFEDSSIDVIISDQVFEHVMNYPQTIEELRRVMRVGGVFLHIFPSRYRVIEPRIYVPLASIFRPRWWLWLWALLGVRNEFQHGLPAREVVEKNAHFLKFNTNYLRTREVKQEFTRCFSQVEFVERVFLLYSNRARALARVWFGATLYGLLRDRFLYGVRAPADTAPVLEIETAIAPLGASREAALS